MNTEKFRVPFEKRLCCTNVWNSVNDSSPLIPSIVPQYVTVALRFVRRLVARDEVTIGRHRLTLHSIIRHGSRRLQLMWRRRFRYCTCHLNTTFLELVLELSPSTHSGRLLHFYR